MGTFGLSSSSSSWSLVPTAHLSSVFNFATHFFQLMVSNSWDSFGFLEILDFDCFGFLDILEWVGNRWKRLEIQWQRKGLKELNSTDRKRCANELLKCEKVCEISLLILT